jgi:hypothetical protein
MSGGLEYPYYTVGDPDLDRVAFAPPVKPKGNYAEKLRRHFAAKRRTEESAK